MLHRPWGIECAGSSRQAAWVKAGTVGARSHSLASRLPPTSFLFQDFFGSAEFFSHGNKMLNLLLLLCLLAISSPANSMNFFGLDPIGVNFCCGEDEKLVVRRLNPNKRVAECVGNGGGKGSSLEGKQVWVGGEAEGELKSLKLLEVRKLMLVLQLSVRPALQSVHC